MSTEERGFVSGVLSGDSLIVRFINKPTQVVCLENLIAPKYGRPDGKYQDEPHGYDSWAYLRDMCIGKRVLVTNSHQTHQTRTHPAFGKDPLPVIFTRVTLYDTNQDVGIAMCEAGWVKMRDSKATNTQYSEYFESLLAAQEDAEKNHRGIWSTEPGFVRPFPIQCNPEDILQRREVEVNIDQIKGPNSFSVFVLPTHENIILTLAGVRPVKNADDSMRTAIRDLCRNKFLNRRVRVSIHKKNDNLWDTPSFTGCFLDEKLDLAVADNIAKGFAIVNKKNLEFAPNPELYIKKQYIAQKNGAGTWAGNKLDPTPSPVLQGSGFITSIKGSNSFYLIIDGQRKVVTLNNVKVPRYNTSYGCDSCGYEASEYLRTHYNKKVVTIDIEGIYEDRTYATIIYKGVSINEKLCSLGLAEYDEWVIGQPSSRVEEIKKAQELAKKQKLGIWADVKPEPVKIFDYTHQKDLKEQIAYIQEQKKVKCIITHVYSSSRFTVLIPEKMWLLSVSLNGLTFISNIDKFGYESKMYSVDNFLQTEVEIEAVSCDDYSYYIWVNMNLCDEAKTDVAVKILENGYSMIQKNYAYLNTEIPQEYFEAQAHAKTMLLGIWADRTRTPFDLLPDVSYPVVVKKVWSPTHISVQHYGPDSAKVTSLLMTPTEPCTEPLLKNECVALHIENNVYRARIENVYLEEKNANVKLIDFDQDMTVPISDLYKLPPELYTIPPQGRTIRQAGVKYLEFTDEEKKKHIQDIESTVMGAALYMQFVSEDENGTNVVLLDKEDAENAVSLATTFIQNHIAVYEECEHPPKLENVFNILKQVQ